MKQGLLLINLGTPEQLNRSSIRRFLREFLLDKRVINLPSFLRYGLVYGMILPFRVNKTLRAYQAIWTTEGSPLMQHMKHVQRQLQDRLGDQWHVTLGMRYGNPSIAAQLNALKDCSDITILPLYPQYASSASGSSLEETLKNLSKLTRIPPIRVIPEFYHHPAYIHTQANLVRPYMNTHEHILFSYHGLPEHHLRESGCKISCKDSCTLSLNATASCYRAQCFQTTQSIAEVLSLAPLQYTTSFQSRLGKMPWIKPYTDEVLTHLAAKGIKRLAVTCPSFVSDCLETLEEIAIRAQQQWLSLGGEQLNLIPCPNADSSWINAIIDIARLNSPTHQ